MSASRSTRARSLRSQFDSRAVRTCTYLGRERCVPFDVLQRFRAKARELAIPFNKDLFLKPLTERLSLPQVDIRFLDRVIQCIGIADTMRLFRGQTTTDPRPNKALCPQRYRTYLRDYDQLDLLCAIAQHGVVPHWRHSDARVAPRPPPRNSPGADVGQAIVTHKLLVDYYAGRCVLGLIVTLCASPDYHSSKFLLVPKKDRPLTEDGRIIHHLSDPEDHSVNAQTDSESNPDATWDPFHLIAQRVLDLRRRYPGYHIYALGADIADAFHHVPIHADHVSAFGGYFPTTQVGIVSGMAVFGWTASPGYFAVLGKATRHYQRQGTSVVLGYSEPYHVYQWVDDIVSIEVDIGDRLLSSETRLRDGVKLVFGADGWHEGKFTTWSRTIHAVGIDWDLVNDTVSIPQRKILKLKGLIAEALSCTFVPESTLKSLIGVLRHIVTFIPVTRPFKQRLESVHNTVLRCNWNGVKMSSELKLDLQWWADIVHEGVYAGVPLSMFGMHPKENDCWIITYDIGEVTVTSTNPRRRVTFRMLDGEQAVIDDSHLSWALLRVIHEWKPDIVRDTWHHVRVHSVQTWVTDLIRKMNSRDPIAQSNLRECGKSLAHHKILLSATRVWSGRISGHCDIHSFTDSSCSQTIESHSHGTEFPFESWSLLPNNFSEHPSTHQHSERTRETSSTGNRSVPSTTSLCGLINCPGDSKHGWLDCMQPYARPGVTIRTERVTSTKRLMERWQLWHSHTKRSGTASSITMIRNLALSLKATSGPTVKWTGSNQSLHPCCWKCTEQWI